MDEESGESTGEEETDAGKSQRNQYAVDGEKQVKVKSAILLTGV